jgi:hypothetical protein
MLPAERWTDLVVLKVCFMKKALEIGKGKTFRILNWNGKRRT